MSDYAKDTIAAISTPIGSGGIGIVRISGPESVHIARKIFQRTIPKTEKEKRNVHKGITKNIIPRQLHYGYIVDPENHTFFNEALMAYMPFPNSYTREDVIEIQAHGGTAALTAILELVINNGARLAQAGEFTRRAYLNGRIDLSQAEAVIDVIQAKTEAALRIANRNLEGDIAKSVRKIRKELLEIKVMIEAQIDFPEEIEETFDEKTIIRKISTKILKPTDEILESYKQGHLFREGVRIVILGRTNVGKSSLLNRFLKRERAIVTSYPGTTRDSLEERIDLNGIPAVFVDTAGLRQTSDPIEKIGIDRTRKLAKSADLILFMVDAGSGVIPEDEHVYMQIRENEKILVLNKADLLHGNNNVNIPKRWRFAGTFYMSAKFGHGFETLKTEIYNKLIRSENMSEDAVVPNLRQKNLITKAKNTIESIVKGLKEKNPLELISIDVQDSIEALDEITGNIVKADVLDEIFSRFCIGK